MKLGKESLKVFSNLNSSVIISVLDMEKDKKVKWHQNLITELETHK